MPHFPHEDTKLRATNLRVRRGGNGGNSLEVLQQFIPTPSDLALHLVTTLPNRHASATAKVVSSFGPDSLVDLSHCIYRDDQTEAASSWIMSSQATGTRTIVNHNGLDEMTTAEFINIADAFRYEDSENMWWHFEVCPSRGPWPDSRMNLKASDAGRMRSFLRFGSRRAMAKNGSGRVASQKRVFSASGTCATLIHGLGSASRSKSPRGRVCGSWPPRLMLCFIRGVGLR